MECWGLDISLDTKIGQINWCHVWMSYASFVIIWHFMSYDAYDINMWHESISKVPLSPTTFKNLCNEVFEMFRKRYYLRIKKINEVLGFKYTCKNRRSQNVRKSVRYKKHRMHKKRRDITLSIGGTLSSVCSIRFKAPDYLITAQVPVNKSKQPVQNVKVFFLS